MAGVTITVINTPPSGYRWELVEGGRTLKSGTAETEPEAHATAAAALNSLQLTDQADQTDQAAASRKRL
jgi:hypothetical protein